MGIKRIMDTGFWTDRKVDNFSPEDKYFMCYLLTGPYTKQLGIYEISIKYVAIHLGYSEDTVEILLDRFEKKYGIIFYSKSTSEVAVKGYLRHSIMKGGKPVEDCIKKDMQNVKNKSLIAKVFKHLSQYDDLNETVKKIINEYDIENDNDNDNDNDVSYHESCYESYSEPEPSSVLPKKELYEGYLLLTPDEFSEIAEHPDYKNYIQKAVNYIRQRGEIKESHYKFIKRLMKETKHKYGEYSNVLLTDEELDKLKELFPDWEDRIERLSSYVASTGKKYKSHYATIRNWARKDSEVKPIKPVYQKQTKAEELDDFYKMAAQFGE